MKPSNKPLEFHKPCPGLGEEEGDALGRTAFLGRGIDHHIYSSWGNEIHPIFFHKDMDGPMFDPVFSAKPGSLGQDVQDELSFGIWTHV